jgi:hypothetical protein
VLYQLSYLAAATQCSPVVSDTAPDRRRPALPAGRRASADATLR